MRATDLMQDYPAVDVSADATEAARAITSGRMAAVLVFDSGHPLTVLPSSQVLTFLIPPWARDDPSLVRVVDEKASDACARRLDGRSVRDLLRGGLPDLPTVHPGATALECAAVMARHRSPLVVVLDKDRQLLGAITAARVLEVLVT